MPYTSFEDLDVWKRACRLATSVYEALRNCRDYGLKDQMTRAAVSVPSNIAEGHERGTTKEFVRYLRIIAAPQQNSGPSSTSRERSESWKIS